jgi:hypothetical protein
MAERKVLNKYYPPDFDPSKLRRFEKKTVRRMCNVRMMLPMSVRCYTCGNYMYIGTKFNMKVETVKDEDYLGIKIYRFYLKCTQCYGEVTFKTDPKNHDYVAEWGASRNHEQWKDMVMAEEEYKEIKQNEMKEDAMKSLEHRTYDSKREMDILDALDQTRNLNRRQADVNFDELIEKIKKKEEVNLNEEEEINRIAKEAFKPTVKRIEDYNGESSNNTSTVDQFDMTSYLTKKLKREEDQTEDDDEFVDINEGEFQDMDFSAIFGNNKNANNNDKKEEGIIKKPLIKLVKKDTSPIEEIKKTFKKPKIDNTLSNSLNEQKQPNSEQSRKNFIKIKPVPNTIKSTSALDLLNNYN